MAQKVNAGDAKRGDMYLVDPQELIIKEENRGRSKPPTEAQIISLAESMLDEGQIQPVECRKVADNKLLLNFGFTRAAAARLIRTGFIDSEGTQRVDPDFRLKVTISPCNDEQALRRNIVENQKRNATTPMDDAMNHQIMRDRYGKSDADIARLYGYSQTIVSRLKKLLLLDQALQDKVHDGSMAVSAAIDILEVEDPEKRKALLEAAMSEDGKVSGSAIRSQVRDHHLNDDNKEPSSNGDGDSEEGTRQKVASAKTRTVKEIRKFFEDIRDSEKGSDEMKAFSKVFIGFLGGTKTDKALHNAFDRLLGS